MNNQALGRADTWTLLQELMGVLSEVPPPDDCYIHSPPAGKLKIRGYWQQESDQVAEPNGQGHVVTESGKWKGCEQKGGKE